MRLFASMRPPEFTGGNLALHGDTVARGRASMRPPEFTGGNYGRPLAVCRRRWCFNEAAGIHRRKPGFVYLAIRTVDPLQ